MKVTGFLREGIFDVTVPMTGPQGPTGRGVRPAQRVCLGPPAPKVRLGRVLSGRQVPPAQQDRLVLLERSPPSVPTASAIQNALRMKLMATSRPTSITNRMPVSRMIIKRL
jgi:hypothetical protein